MSAPESKRPDNRQRTTDNRPAPSLPEPRWSLPTRIAFRFFFAFLVLVYFPFPLTAVTGIAKWWSGTVNKLVAAAWHALTGVSLAVNYNGSGDRLVDWVRLLAFAVLAVIVTIVWSIADRRRPGYAALQRWFRLYIRFALAVAMISYGAYKVFPSQFVTPALDRLLEAIGDQSPMGLLWNFMGASVPYTIFGGLGELIGGLLLTNRRTALLGALVSAAVMSQVVMLNFSYDVPVKIYSSELLLTALVIIAPDAGKLRRFFLPEAGPAPHLAFRIVIVLFVAWVTVTQFRASWKDRQEWDEDMSSPSTLAGIWNVDELTLDGVAHPPLTTDLTRWRRWIVEGKENVSIQSMDDRQTYYQLTLDERRKSIVLKRRTGAASLVYERPNLQTLLVHGTLAGKPVTATLHKDTGRTFLLTTRGFHWVNERPFSR
jgi:hypothetical protein